MEFLTTWESWGYLGLFVDAFLAATILPLSSEVLLVVLLKNQYSPAATILIATLGNVLGAVVNYLMGLYGGWKLLRKVVKISDQEVERAKNYFSRFGVGALFFAWAPVVGDPLTVVAGMLGVNGFVFLALVTAGKLLRYVIVAYAAISA